ncbi:S41 family peptidase [Parapedobacter koreensis]|uniref:C-terminal processing peptidase-3. Serine peptidase. MEROPS family S41A n=1 Tax=Parapedobacter koreensis TaxID=332977 RepID=A0A1H7QB92_9SPHI|nr:S41 family peptidase [Parapedobacter koreensis]SEL45156.1 C-terminal processing peptidase-3. Serine peptidase. MEROPS family S41A [Parapedobacter koreensis]
MRKETRRNLFIAATYGGALFLGLLLGQNYADENSRSRGGAGLLPLGFSDKTGKVQHIIDLIATNYVDSVDIDRLQDLAIDEIVAQLDPHSEYLHPNQALKQYETLEGTFEGIGIEYYILNDTLMTVGLINGGPAQQAGLRVGDRLIAINGDTVAGVHITDKVIEGKIRGQKGTAIEITINRNGKNLPLPIKVLRDRVEVSSIDAAYIIDSATAYIKIRRFGAKTADDFKHALQNLKKQGAQRLVLDLRENGGGYFHAATALASQFFEDKRLIVYTEGAHEPRVDYYSSADGIFGDGELAVLIDEQSASASEIVAGAIQDLERGIIIGQRSYGKALVQEQFGLGDGSALNLTVARYYTPLGRSIQKSYTIHTGKDVHITNRPAQRGNTVDTIVYKTETGKLVYGEGGISPDISVPIDSNGISTLYRKIRQANLIETYVYGKLTQSLPAYAVENYLKGYFLPDKEYQNFLQHVRDKGVVYTLKEANAVKPMVRTDIEALLGRYYFGSEAFFKVRNRSDNVLAQALLALRSE